MLPSWLTPILVGIGVLVFTCSFLYVLTKWLVDKYGPQVPSIPIIPEDQPFLSRLGWMAFQFIVFVGTAKLLLDTNDAELRDGLKDWTVTIILIAGSTTFTATVVADWAVAAVGRARMRWAKA